MKLPIIWFVAFVGLIFGLGCLVSYGDQLQWQTPAGLVNLNLNTTEVLTGYDAVLRESVAGASLPIYTDPKGLVSVQAGAIAPWPNNGSTVEPYLAAGHDILKEIPGLQDYKTLHVNIFGRYATNVGKAGVGVSISYSFLQ